MRTTIVLDEDLVAEAQRLTGLRTKRGVIEHALRELVRRRQRRRLLELRGRIKWEGNSGKCGASSGAGAFCLVPLASSLTHSSSVAAEPVWKD
jgi:Arc/MetJ family transcription regulator